MVSVAITVTYCLPFTGQVIGLHRMGRGPAGSRRADGERGHRRHRPPCTRLPAGIGHPPVGYNVMSMPSYAIWMPASMSAACSADSSSRIGLVLLM